MPRNVSSATSRAIKAAYTNVLSINTLSVDISLGISKEERKMPQNVAIDVRFYFPSLLSSAHDDNGDYMCYHSISEKIYALCKSKEFRLIEYLNHEIYRLVRKEVTSSTKLWVKVRKSQILLPYVSGGTSYSYTDLPPFSWVLPE